MPPSARRPRGLAALFKSDPYAALTQVLRDAGTAMNAAEIKQALHAAGVTHLDKTEWRRLQRQLRADDHVVVEPGHRYRWVDKPPTVFPADALDELVRVAKRRVKPSYVAILKQALLDTPNEQEVEAQHRHAVRHGLRLLAELASEVEELAVSQASARALIHRVRSRVRQSDLEPIEHAGDIVAYDPSRHQLIGDSVPRGAKVRVVRPGYVLKTVDEEVVLARAAVIE